MALKRCAPFLQSRQSLFTQPVRTGFFQMINSKGGLNRDTFAMLQQPIDLSKEGIMRWLKKKHWNALKQDHSFEPERHKLLGPHLAAAHFLVARDGAVKFKDSPMWVEKDKDGKYVLPTRRVDNLYVEALDASGTQVMYESFGNFVNLQTLQYLNLSRCPNVDDWCMDILHRYKDSLVCLDVSECPNVTERGLASLHKLNKLQRLRMYNMPSIKEKELSVLMLEELLPNCIIESEVNYAHVPSIRDSASKDIKREDLAGLPGVLLGEHADQFTDEHKTDQATDEHETDQFTDEHRVDQFSEGHKT